MKDTFTITVNRNFGNAGHGQQSRLDLVFDDIGQFFLGQTFADHGKAHDGTGIGVGLDDTDVFDVIRQTA